MFKIQEQGKPETAIWLNKLETLLSTDGQADITLTKSYMQEMVCSAKICAVENDKLFIADLTFNQDISINEQVIAKGSRAELSHGDVITVGNNTFEIFNPSSALKRLSTQDTSDTSDTNWHLDAVSNWLEGQSFKIKGKAVLGRDNACDITIPGSHLSRRHAEIFVVGDSLLVKDLGSANGSFINGKPFTETKAKDGDELRFDQLSFKVIAPLAMRPKTPSPIPANAHDKTEATSNASQGHTGNKQADKQWVTKPTSVGNQITDADIRLQNHQKNQRLTYLIFGLAIATAIVGTLIWQFVL